MNYKKYFYHMIKMGYDFTNGMYMTFNFRKLGEQVHCNGRDMQGRSNKEMKIMLKNAIMILKHMGANEKYIDTSYINFGWGLDKNGKQLEGVHYFSSYLYILQAFLDKTEEYKDNYVWWHDYPCSPKYDLNVFDYTPLFDKFGVDITLIIIDFMDRVK